MTKLTVARGLMAIPPAQLGWMGSGFSQKSAAKVHWSRRNTQGDPATQVVLVEAIQVARRFS